MARAWGAGPVFFLDFTLHAPLHRLPPGRCIVCRRAQWLSMELAGVVSASAPQPPIFRPQSAPMVRARPKDLLALLAESAYEPR